MLPSWANDIVTIIRPSTKEIRGSPVPDWSNISTHIIEGCSMQPTSTSLYQDGRVAGISEGFTCYLPPHTDVKAGDRIEFCGNIYTITGEPQIWKSPSGRVSNVQLSLERWHG